MSALWVRKATEEKTKIDGYMKWARENEWVIVMSGGPQRVGGILGSGMCHCRMPEVFCYCGWRWPFGRSSQRKPESKCVECDNKEDPRIRRNAWRVRGGGGDGGRVAAAKPLLAPLRKPFNLSLDWAYNFLKHHFAHKLKWANGTNRAKGREK